MTLQEWLFAVQAVIQNLPRPTEAEVLRYEVCVSDPAVTAYGRMTRSLVVTLDFAEPPAPDAVRATP